MPRKPPKYIYLCTPQDQPMNIQSLWTKPPKEPHGWRVIKYELVGEPAAEPRKSKPPHTRHVPAGVGVLCNKECEDLPDAASSCLGKCARVKGHKGHHTCAPESFDRAADKEITR